MVPQPQKYMYKNVLLFCLKDQLRQMDQFIEEKTNSHLKSSLREIIETDENGFIVLFRPTIQISMGFLFFLQNLMLMQRLYFLDDFLRRNGQIK